MRAPSNFKNLNGELACLPAAPELQNPTFEREDWTLFRTVEGLQQKAGVPQDKLRRLVLKEMTDNGLDNGAKRPRRRAAETAAISSRTTAPASTARRKISPACSASPSDGLDQAAAAADPWRARQRPARGRRCRARLEARSPSSPAISRIELRPERDGTTTVVSVKPVKFPIGTRVEISFGPAFRGRPTRCTGRTVASCWRTAERPTPASHRRSGTTPRNFTNCFRQRQQPVRELVANSTAAPAARAGRSLPTPGSAACSAATSAASRPRSF